MISPQGSYGKQVACWSRTTAALGRIAMYNTLALHSTTEILAVPADDVAANVVESRKPAAREFSYISPGEAP